MEHVIFQKGCLQNDMIYIYISNLYIFWFYKQHSFCHYAFIVSFRLSPLTLTKKYITGWNNCRYDLHIARCQADNPTHCSLWRWVNQLNNSFADFESCSIYTWLKNNTDGGFLVLLFNKAGCKYDIIEAITIKLHDTEDYDIQKPDVWSNFWFLFFTCFGWPMVDSLWPTSWSTLVQVMAERYQVIIGINAE